MFCIPVSLSRMIKTEAQYFHQDKIRVKTCLAILIGLSSGSRGQSCYPAGPFIVKLRSRYRQTSPSQSQDATSLQIHQSTIIRLHRGYKATDCRRGVYYMMNDARLTLDITSGPTYQLLRYQSSIMYCLVSQHSQLSLTILIVEHQKMLNFKRFDLIIDL